VSHWRCGLLLHCIPDHLAANQVRAILQPWEPTGYVWLFCSYRTDKSHQASCIQGAATVHYCLLWQPRSNPLFLAGASFILGIINMWCGSGRSPIGLHTRILPRWNPNITTWWPNGSSWCWEPFTPVVADCIIIPTRLILLIYDSDKKTQNYNQLIIHLIGIDIMQASRVPQPTIHDLNVGLIVSPLFTKQIWSHQ